MLMQALLQFEHHRTSGTSVPMSESPHDVFIIRKAFLHDFEGGKSEHAKRIFASRRKGVSPAMEYAGFIVRPPLSSIGYRLTQFRLIRL